MKIMDKERFLITTLVESERIIAIRLDPTGRSEPGPIEMNQFKS